MDEGISTGHSRFHTQQLTLPGNFRHLRCLVIIAPPVNLSAHGGHVLLVAGQRRAHCRSWLGTLQLSKFGLQHLQRNNASSQPSRLTAHKASRNNVAERCLSDLRRRNVARQLSPQSQDAQYACGVLAAKVGDVQEQPKTRDSRYSMLQQAHLMPSVQSDRRSES